MIEPEESKDLTIETDKPEVIEQAEGETGKALEPTEYSGDKKDQKSAQSDVKNEQEEEKASYETLL